MDGEENIVTKETINDVEYLREQHDYHLIVLDQEQDMRSLRSYFAWYSEKALGSNGFFFVSHQHNRYFGGIKKIWMLNVKKMQTSKTYICDMF